MDICTTKKNTKIENGPHDSNTEQKKLKILHFVIGVNFFKEDLIHPDIYAYATIFKNFSHNCMVILEIILE